VDDIVLVACSEDELQELVNRLDQLSSRYNLVINIEKTKVMATANQQCDIMHNTRSQLREGSNIPIPGIHHLR